MKHLRDGFTQIVILIVGYALMFAFMHYLAAGTPLRYLADSDPEGTITIREAFALNNGENFLSVPKEFSGTPVYEWVAGKLGGSVNALLDMKIGYEAADVLTIYFYVYGFIGGIFCFAMGLGYITVLMRQLMEASRGLYGMIDKIPPYRKKNGAVPKDAWIDKDVLKPSPIDTGCGVINLFVLVLKMMVMLHVMSIYGLLLPVLAAGNIVLGVLSLPFGLIKKNAESPIIKQRTSAGFRTYAAVNYYGQGMLVNCSDSSDGLVFGKAANAYLARAVMQADGENQPFNTNRLMLLLSRFSLKSLYSAYKMKRTMASVGAIAFTSVKSGFDENKRRFTASSAGRYFTISREKSPFELKIYHISNMELLCSILAEDEAGRTYTMNACNAFMNLPPLEKMNVTAEFIKTHTAAA